MASYKLQIKPSAVKELEAIQIKDRKRLVAKIETTSPKNHDPMVVKNSPVRISTVCDKDTIASSIRLMMREPSITIIKIGHRRDVYR